MQVDYHSSAIFSVLFLPCQLTKKCQLSSWVLRLQGGQLLADWHEMQFQHWSPIILASSPKLFSIYVGFNFNVNCKMVFQLILQCLVYVQNHSIHCFCIFSTRLFIFPLLEWIGAKLSNIEVNCALKFLSAIKNIQGQTGMGLEASYHLIWWIPSCKKSKNKIR